MQANRTSILLLLLGSILLSSCRMSKQLSVHRSAMQALVSSNLSPEHKFDALAETLSTVLDESLSLRSPVSTYRYLNKFTNQNDRELTIIIDELDAWQEEMSIGQKLKLAAKMAGKPYARKLLIQIPKVSNRMAECDYKLGKLERALVLFKLKQMMK